MKLVLISVLGIAVSSATAHAQLAVVDPTLNTTALGTLAKQALTEIHEAQQVINTAQTVIQVTGVLNAAAHGNIMGLGALAPLLTNESSPLAGGSGGGGGQAASDIKDLITVGKSIGQLGNNAMNLIQQAKSLTTNYQSPKARDFNAVSMARQAYALAAQLGLGQQSLTSTSNRSLLMPGLIIRSESAIDIKSAMDANNTIAAQGVIQTNQTNQLLALQIMQNANQQNERNLAEQEWRRQTDQMGASAAAAAAAAKSGTIQFARQ